MKISKHNLKILKIFNIIRFILSYLLIFKMDMNDIFKSFLLYLPFGIDDIDSIYPYILGFYKKTKKKYKHFSIGANKEFGDYYTLTDKINDLSTNWMFMYYLNKNKKLTDNQLLILYTVLINRTWGSILYSLKNSKYLKKLKIKRNVFFFFPDYFSIYSIIFLISQNNNWNVSKITRIIITASILKNIQEYFLHVVK